MPEINYTVSSKQMELIQNNVHRYILMHGGRATGKTTGAGIKALELASTSGARVAIFRKRLQDLKATTLKTLLDGDGSMPPLLPLGCYHHNKMTRTIKIKGAGEIIYNGLDNGAVSRESGSTGKGSGLNLSAAIFDEAVEITANDFAQLDFSVRVGVKDKALQTILVCNPSHPRHWIYEKFNLGGNPPPNHVAIHSTIDDNIYLDKSYIEITKANYTGVAYDRYIRGMWVGYDGLVYDYYDPEIHRTESQTQIRTTILGVDDGTADPFTVLRCDIDDHDCMHVSKEIYQTGLVSLSKIEAVKSLLRNLDDLVVVDSAALDLIKSLRNAGVNAVGVKKTPGSINFGIDLVQGRLKGCPILGRPKLTLSYEVPNLASEFLSYIRGKRGDRFEDNPVDKDNHALDALRYVCMHIERSKGLGAFSMGGPAEDVTIDESTSLVINFGRTKELSLEGRYNDYLTNGFGD